MTKKQILIVALGVCILVYRGLDFWQVAEGRTSASDLGVGLDLTGDGLRVTRIQAARLDGRPTAAALAGLRPGDTLVACEGPTGRRVGIDNLLALRRGLSVMDSAGGVLVFHRPSPAGPTEVRLARSTPGAFGWVYLGLRAFPLLVLPLLAVLTALLIVSLKPDDGQAFLAGLLFLSFSCLFGTEFWRLPPVIREVSGTVHECLATAFGYLLLRFFLVFPGPSRLDRAAPWLKHVLLVPVGLLALAGSALTIAALYSLPTANRIIGAFGGAVGMFFSAAFVLGTTVLGLLTGIWELVRAPTPSAQRRLGILLGGALAGLLPMLAAVAYFAIRKQDAVTPWVAMLVLPTLPLFPMSFIYAVVRHRVLGVTLIVRKGVQYALVSRGFLAVEGLMVFVALYYGVGPEVARAFPAAGGGALATTNAVATLAVLAGISGMNRRLKPALDRRFFRDRYNAHAVMSALGDDLAGSPTDPGEMAAALATRLATSLHARAVTVFLDDRLGRDAKDSAASHAPSYVRLATAGAEERDAAAWYVPVHLLAAAADARVRDPAAARPVAILVEPGEPLLDALWEHGVRLVVPMSGRDAFLGWLVLGDKLSEEAYTLEDRAFVQAAAQQVATALDYSRLIGRIAEQEAMRRELDIARQVQEGLFPQRRPAVATLDYYGACRTAREVGGDYFDFLEIDGSRLGLAVGDISGKGVSAALLMANLQAMFRSRAASQGAEVGRLVADINRLLVDSTDPSKFATLFYGVFHAGTRRLLYVNAGHNPPMLVRAGTTEVHRLQPTGMALGFTATACYDAAEEPLRPGDVLVVFTDGLTEALDEHGNEYGEDRLAAVLLEERGLEAQRLCEHLLADVSRHVGRARQHDDVTLVVARVK